MNPIANALTQGFSHQNILQYLLRHFPHARKQIESALAKGFTADKIVDFLQGGRKEVNKSVTEHEKTRQSDKEKQRNLEKGIVKGGLALGATALGGYALSRALPRAGSALAGQLLPALPNSPVGPGNQLPGPQQTINVTPQGGPTPQVPPLTGPQSPRGQQNVQQSPPLPMPTPRAEQSQATIKSPPLPQALQDHALTMLGAGNSIDKVAGALKSLQPKIVKDYEKNTGQSIDRAVQDFASSYLPPKQRGTDSPISPSIMEKGLQPEEQQINEITEPGESTPEEIKETRKKEKGSTVALPNGDIGEIINIRQGIATVNARGKEYRRKIDEIEEAPHDLEEATRHLMKLIPEKSKSTVIQESIHLDIPGEEGESTPLLLTKFWDGKIGWYKGIDNDTYSKISLGTYEPKTKGKTSIGEYKPGVIDSTGAAFHDLIRMNPEYSKENKGITWGYANDWKGALKEIQPALTKMSREKVDEKGKIAEKRKKTVGKGSENTRVSKPRVKTEEKIRTDKEDKKVLQEKPTRLREISKQAESLEKSQDIRKKLELKTEFEKELKKIDKIDEKPEKLDITPKKLKEQKNYILSKLQQALDNPKDSDYIRIQVPNDGNFTIVNRKESLESFYDKVQKKWPTSALKSNVPKPYKR